LSLTCEPRFSIGGRPSGEEVVFGRATPLLGSDVGIVIDARGRPLQSGGDTTQQTARVANWLTALDVKL
jgi:hypothetical protein